MPAGRPSKYKPEYAKQAKRLCDLGATDMQLADFFEVDVVTLNSWKTKHPEFLKSLKVGKAEADANVKRSLYQRAIGFEHDTVKVAFDKAGQPMYAPYREYVIPDTTACIFWLKNRMPAEFRDKVETEHTFSDLAATIAEARKRVSG